jgi:hypothetical protein
MMRKVIIAAIVFFAFVGLGICGPPVAPSPVYYDADGNIVAPADMIVTGSATMATSRSGLSVVSSAGNIILTSADWGKVIWMTGAGEVQLPDAGASDIGKYITIIVRDALEQVEIALTDATELFVREDGTALDAGDELDMATAALSKVTVAYMETGKWYVLSGITTDGGVAD